MKSMCFVCIRLLSYALGMAIQWAQATKKYVTAESFINSVHEFVTFITGDALIPQAKGPFRSEINFVCSTNDPCGINNNKKKSWSVSSWVFYDFIIVITSSVQWMPGPGWPIGICFLFFPGLNSSAIFVWNSFVVFRLAEQFVRASFTGASMVLVPLA